MRSKPKNLRTPSLSHLGTSTARCIGQTRPAWLPSGWVLAVNNPEHIQGTDTQNHLTQGTVTALAEVLAWKQGLMAGTELGYRGTKHTK